MNIEDIKKLRALAAAADQPHSGVAREYFRQSVTAPRMLDLLDLAERQLSNFQQCVQPWMLACFGETIAGDREERNHRFLEEALELVQSTGCTASEAHQLVDYVYGRPVGEPVQEVGGVMVTLAALCLANDLDMHAAAETELARIWTKVEQTRAKQAAKPKHSPLPETAPQRHAQEALSDEQILELAGEIFNFKHWKQTDEIKAKYLAFANAILANRQPAPSAAHNKHCGCPNCCEPAPVAAHSITMSDNGMSITVPARIDDNGNLTAIVRGVLVKSEPLAVDVALGDVLSHSKVGVDLLDLACDITRNDRARQKKIYECVPTGELHDFVKEFVAQRAASHPPRPTYDWCPECHARESAGEPDSELATARTAQQERAWFKEWVAGRQCPVSVDQVEFGRLAWAERARRAAKGGA